MDVPRGAGVCLLQWRIKDFPEEPLAFNADVLTYNFAIFCQKLHEHDRIWTPRGRQGRPLDPPMGNIKLVLHRTDYLKWQIIARLCEDHYFELSINAVRILIFVK